MRYPSGDGGEIESVNSLSVVTNDTKDAVRSQTGRSKAPSKGPPARWRCLGCVDRERWYKGHYGAHVGRMHPELPFGRFQHRDGRVMTVRAYDRRLVYTEEGDAMSAS